jgi:photosystem II stability/assembly factor-like uncharacterized protein
MNISTKHKSLKIGFIPVIAFSIIIHYTLFINESYSQWIKQYAGTIILRDVEFINIETGWACGENGFIIKTTNRGKTWNEQINPSSGMGKALYRLHPLDSNTLYCVGMFETILKTTNGGNNWTAILNGPWGQGNSYFGTFFVNENTGWVAGTGYKIMKTTNGGSTFDSVFFSASYIRDFYFKNSMEGILCGDGGIVRRTTNGGLNWLWVNIQLYGNLYDFRNISFVNNNYGWVVGNIGPVYYTTDFGINWDSIGYVAGADLIYCHRFTSQLTGYCGGSYARMFKTTDGGYSWRRQNTSVIQNGFFTSFWFSNDSIGWTTVSGKILHTTTGGEFLVNVSSNNQEEPDCFYLYQNYPNPFNNKTIIKFDINEKNIYSLSIYDCLGRKREELLNEYLNEGNYSIVYNANNL